MKFPWIARVIPSWKNAILAIFSAILLILAFPDFEYWFLAWFALVPLLIAVEREKGSSGRSFVLGWLWGVVFFFGTCWWLTYAPIHFAAFPWPLAYFLLFWVVAVAAIFPALFAAITRVLLRRFGSWAFFAVPFVWVTTEFARYWITGNNWNAIGYSQFTNDKIAAYAAYGGIELTSFVIVTINLAYGGMLLGAFWVYASVTRKFISNVNSIRKNRPASDIFASPYDAKYSNLARNIVLGILILLVLNVIWSFVSVFVLPRKSVAVVSKPNSVANVIGIQPNVPMSGLDPEKWTALRDRQIELAEQALSQNKREGIGEKEKGSTTVILPESPMNFEWAEDPDFQRYIGQFAAKNNVNVLFNSAEPDRPNHKYFNSAVMVDATGREVAEYDKIYLLPFGEAVPVPLENIVPGFVGNFSYGKNYDLVPLGDAKAGIMICFESHFGELSRQYVRNGADAIIEMTNDGYLGPTPVLRQHLANAVFRAIETNRPVLRVTNVGITTYITERGEVLDATQPYTEDTRVWSVAKSDGSQTFYVKYGDWFAWVSTGITLMMFLFGFLGRKEARP
jgi:apolipoprotein N-acyltransferase